MFVCACIPPPKQKTGEPQVVPGTIGLVYDSRDLAAVLSRLTRASNSVDERGGDRAMLEGTEFRWREAEGGEEKEEKFVDVTCPYGERERGSRGNETPIVSATATPTQLWVPPSPPIPQGMTKLFKYVLLRKYLVCFFLFAG